MLVINVLKFIEELNQLNGVSLFDQMIIGKLNQRFKEKNSEMPLTHEDQLYLLKCFEQRWRNLFQTENSYTLNQNSENKIWIEFSKQFALFTKKNYLHLLMPTVKNHLDYNDLSNLNETVRIENFFLSSDGAVLYRKRAFCELLISNQYQLAIKRLPHNNKLSPLTIDELYSFSINSNIKNEFLIDDEHFYNFWDFLRKKVFSKLSHHGKVPVGMIPKLYLLIETYFLYKEKNYDYLVFKSQANQFFVKLLKCNLANINHLYGVEIPFKDNKIYLLDIFIEIYKSEQYDLDEYIIQIAIWLFRYNSVLKPNLPCINDAIHPILASDSMHTSTTIRQLESREDRMPQCLSLALSLFIYNFDNVSLMENKVNFWDKMNYVPYEVKHLVSNYILIITENKYDKLADTYNKLLEFIRNHSYKSQNIISKVIRSEATSRWFKLITKEDYQKLGVYWREPELIFETLLLLMPLNDELSVSVTLFLDDLIRTYAQSNNELMKKIRVNIQFSEFLRSLDGSKQKEILLLSELIKEEDAKNNLIKNVMSYLSDRLSQFASMHFQNKNQFFCNVIENDSSLLIIFNEKLNTVDKIVDAFKEFVYSKALKIEENKLVKMKEYLQLLCKPILSISEKEEAKSSSQQGLYWSM